MPLYSIRFVDHGRNVYRIHTVEGEHDAAAIRAARDINAPTIGAGFEVWCQERFIHWEPNSPLSRGKTADDPATSS